MMMMVVMVTSMVAMERVEVDVLATCQFLAQADTLLGIALQSSWALSGELGPDAVGKLQARRIALDFSGSGRSFSGGLLGGLTDHGDALVSHFVGHRFLPVVAAEFVADMVASRSLHQIAFLVKLDVKKRICL